jgi:hypothetical protein
MSDTDRFHYILRAMRIGAVLAAACLMVFAAAAWGQGPAGIGGDARIPPSVEAYARAVRGATLPVESIYRLGLRAADDLVNHESVLEYLSETDYATVQDKMAGFLVNREEIVFAEPIPKYFSRLSHDRRDSVSFAFFEACRLTTSYAPWNSYIEQQTDYSGCIKLGSLELVRCYRVWAGFKRRHPGRYADRVELSLSDLGENLTTGVCSCAGKDEALLEFRAFVREFPNASITPRVRERIRALEAGTSDIRYHCSPG